MELLGKIAIRKILTLWIISVGLFLAPIYIGTFFTSKFDSEYALYRAIIWFLIATFPIFLLITIIYLKVDANKRINKFNYKLIYWISVFYLITIFVIVMIRPFFNMVENIEKSFYLTLPLEFLLLLLLYFTFFGKRESYGGVIEKQFEQKRKFIIDLITTGDIDRAFQEIVAALDVTDDKKIFDELLTLKTQWEMVKKDKGMSLVSYEFIQVHQSRIINHLIQLVNRL